MAQIINIKSSQVFTPQKYVISMLDEINYTNNLFNKKILENSCGNGSFLKEIVKRYIVDCMNNKIEKEKIIYGISRDIVAFEIDESKIVECKNALNILVSQYGLEGIEWNIINDDFLKHNVLEEFDYIVGNPPYIDYRGLDSDTRVFLKEKFKSCNFGKFDYFYPFIEKSLNHLKDDGYMAYVIPNSLFKNISAKGIREIIKPYIYKIIENFGENVFERVNVSPSIIYLKKEISQEFEYNDLVEKRTNLIKKGSLIDKWIFNYDNNEVLKFADYYEVGSSIATLYNKAYIFTTDNVDDDFYYVGEYKIEKEIVRKTMSPRSCTLNKKEFIIFPYGFLNGKIKRYSDKEFETLFPQAANYLRQFKTNLDNSSKDVSAKWFEYGRSQAINAMFNKKLMMSIIITNEVKIYELDENEIPYSGIYIIQKEEGWSLEYAKNLLESTHFFDYVKKIGVISSKKSRRITPNDVKKYKFKGN